MSSETTQTAARAGSASTDEASPTTTTSSRPALQLLRSSGAKPNPSDRPWSYSQLSAFELCPRKWAEETFYKRHKQKEGASQSEGKETHEAFARRIRTNKGLPLRLRQHEKFVAAILGRIPEAEATAEERIGINDRGEPVDFFAPDVWCRGIIDLIVYDEERAIIVDWKTGRVRPDFDQLDLMAAMTQCLIPSLRHISGIFYWTRDAKAWRDTVKKYDTDDLPKVWESFLPRVAVYQEAIDARDFPARPNFLCARFCPVVTCEHHGKQQ